MIARLARRMMDSTVAQLLRRNAELADEVDRLRRRVRALEEERYGTRGDQRERFR